MAAGNFPNWKIGGRFPPIGLTRAQIGTLMNQIARRLCGIRDEHMANLLADQVLRGERVFALAGYTHVIMQEEAVRHALR